MVCFMAVYCISGVFLALPDRTPELMMGVATVESNCDPNAIGDNGNARGMFQIWEAFWIDGTEYLGVDWDYMTDVWDVDKSAQVVLAYWRRYAAFYIRKTGKPVTLKVISMLHNAGPYGWCDSNPERYENALTYWRKVEKVLND